nr:leucine zipper domain-containing protein [Streptomyces rimosus]
MHRAWTGRAPWTKPPWRTASNASCQAVQGRRLTQTAASHYLHAWCGHRVPRTGRPTAHVAAEAGVSRRCLVKWVARWSAHGGSACPTTPTARHPRVAGQAATAARPAA